MVRYQLLTLGSVGLTISDDGASPVQHPLGGHAFPMALLAILASRHAPMRREEVLALLWPESSQSAARNSLNQLIARIRREIGQDLIVSEGQVLSLNPEQVDADVARFRDAIDRSDFEAAASLYGEFLPGLVVLRSPEFEEWLSAERLRLRSAIERLAESVAAGHLASGDSARAGEACARLLALNPLSEAGVRMAMQASLESGTPGVGLTQYREFCRRNLEDTGLGPSALTEQLAGQLQAAHAAALLPLSQPAARTFSAPALVRSIRRRIPLQTAAAAVLVVVAGLWFGTRHLASANAAAADDAVVLMESANTVELVAFDGLTPELQAHAALVHNALAGRLGEQRGIELRMSPDPSDRTAGIQITGQLWDRGGMPSLRVSVRSDVVHAAREFPMADVQQGVEAVALFVADEIMRLRTSRRVSVTAPSARARTMMHDAGARQSAADDVWATGDFAAAGAAYRLAYESAATAAARFPRWIEPVLLMTAAANRVAWSHMGTGSIDDARVWVETALGQAAAAATIDSMDARGHDWQGQLLYYSWTLSDSEDDAAMLSAAERHLERAVELDPAAGNAWATLGSLRLRRGAYQAAAQAALRAIESDVGVNRSGSLNTYFFAQLNVDLPGARAACGRLEAEREGFWDATLCRHLLMIAGGEPADLDIARESAERHLARETQQQRASRSNVLAQLQTAIEYRQHSISLDTALMRLRTLASASEPSHLVFLAAAYHALDQDADARRVLQSAKSIMGSDLDTKHLQRLLPAAD